MKEEKDKLSQLPIKKYRIQLWKIKNNIESKHLHRPVVTYTSESRITPLPPPHNTQFTLGKTITNHCPYLGM